RLLNELEAEASRQQRKLDVLLEVNTSGEAQKHGFRPVDLVTLIELIGRLENLRVCGLMTMAALEEDPERCRRGFAMLHKVQDDLRSNLEAIHPFHHLSMGMSNDFEVAVEEGATIVRIGTAMFEGVV